LSGIVLVVISLAVSLVGNVGFSFPELQIVSRSVGTLAVTLLLLVVLIVAGGRWLPTSERFGQLVLSPDMRSSGGFTSANTDASLVGRTGTAITPLRPAGIAMIDDRRIDVISAGEYIDSGSDIRVISSRGARVEVREIST
ncbi:MAG: membrane-bound serine protease (ClpP class), partial [Thalassolituus oleivorans]